MGCVRKEKERRDYNDSDFDFSDEDRIKALKELLGSDFDKFSTLELKHIVVGDIAHLVNVLSANNAIIMPNRFIHDLDSNVCPGRILGAEYILYLLVRLDSEESTYDLTQIAAQITKNFVKKEEWRNLKGTTGNAYIIDTDFRADNFQKLRLFSAKMTIKLNY